MPKPRGFQTSVKAAKPKENDYILIDGDGLQMRARANGSKLWNFNYIHLVTKKRINMGLDTFPEVSLAQARNGRLKRDSDLALAFDRRSSETSFHAALRKKVPT